MKHARLVWDQADETGIEVLDKQHQSFVKIANDIFMLTDGGDLTRAELISIVLRLQEYVHFHFNTEEEMLGKMSGPEVAAHLKKHEQNRRKIAGLVETVTKSDENLKKLADKISDFVNSYVTKHMLTARNEAALFEKL